MIKNIKLLVSPCKDSKDPEFVTLHIKVHINDKVHQITSDMYWTDLVSSYDQFMEEAVIELKRAIFEMENDLAPVIQLVKD